MPENWNSKKLASAEELQTIRDWLGKIPYIDLTLCDDNFIQHYYFHRRGSLQETKEGIHDFFKAHLMMRKEFVQLDPARQAVQDYYDSAIDFVFPNLTEDGALISYHSLRPLVHQNYGPESILMMRRRSIWKCVKHPPTVNKIISIFDFENYSLEVMSRFDLDTFKVFMNANFKSVPLRVGKIHAINVSPIGRAALSLVKSLINAKFPDRIIVHPDLESLHKHVPKSILPSDLGGELGTREELLDEYRKSDLSIRDIHVKWQESFNKNHGKFTELMEDIDSSSFRKLELD